MGKFRDRMARDLAIRNLAQSTIETYLRGARGLIAHYRRSPDAISREDVLVYLDHLRTSGLAPSSRAVYQAGICFLYRVTRKRADVVADLMRPKVPQQKCRVLKGSEIKRLMEAMPSPKHRAVFAATYSCGLRISETCGLLIADIDSARGRILVRCAKGAKERYVPLGATLLQELRAYYRAERPQGRYLFPGRRTPRRMVTRTFNKVLTAVSDHLGFEPRVTPHTQDGWCAAKDRMSESSASPPTRVRESSG